MTHNPETCTPCRVNLHGKPPPKPKPENTIRKGRIVSTPTHLGGFA